MVKGGFHRLAKPWSLPGGGVAERLEVDPERGLDEAEVRRRAAAHGSNRLTEHRGRGALAILVDQFRSLVVLLLVAAAVAAALLDEWLDAAAILAVLIINAAIGFTTEIRALKSMAALRALGVTRVRLLRGGRRTEVAAEALVPGDILLLEAGDMLPADLRILDCARLEADESALTGESAPVAKSADADPEDSVLADRRSMLWRGTALTRGSARAVVTAIGMDTELGHIAGLVAAAEDTESPLERRLQRLGGRLLVVTLVIAVLIFALGIAVGRPPLLMVITAIALAVAAIPEGLPIVATIALARGMWRMARERALINRLSAVETLGSTTIIFTDKTGTLTENRMTVRRLHAPNGEFDWPSDASKADAARSLLRAIALCNDAEILAEGAQGDPMEIAFLEAAALAGLRHAELNAEMPRVRIEPFDPDLMMMASFNREEGRILVTVKGAPERVLERCTAVLSADGEPVALDDEGRHAFVATGHELARDGLRVLAAAEKYVADDAGEAFDDLVFLGFVALADPPRSDVAAAIAACRRAGIAVHMVTGDQPATAGAIAREVGIGEKDERPVSGAELSAAPEAEREGLRSGRIFARVTPAQKLELVEHWQERGEIVAMTGDGVNDAPALKKADIGVAMGKRGTQVARDAADMVLTDDSFPAIVAAVREGRIIFANIRRVVIYLLSCNVSEVLVVAIGTAVAGLTPLRPLQILFLNLLTDVFPALALAFGAGPADVLDRPPRPKGEGILERRHWRGILNSAAVMSFGVLLAFGGARHLLELDEAGSVTVAFIGLGLAQLWHVLNLRSPVSGVLRNEILANPWLGGALLLCLLLFVLALYWPPLALVLGTAALGPEGLLVALIASLPTVILGQFLLRGGRSGYFSEETSREVC